MWTFHFLLLQALKYSQNSSTSNSGSSSDKNKKAVVDIEDLIPTQSSSLTLRSKAKVSFKDKSNNAVDKRAGENQQDKEVFRTTLSSRDYASIPHSSSNRYSSMVLIIAILFVLISFVLSYVL